MSAGFEHDPTCRYGEHLGQSCLQALNEFNRRESDRCTCANDGSARRCPHHTQEDFDSSVERATVDEALAAWEAKGPTSLTVAMLADALYGVREAGCRSRRLT